MSSTTFDTLKFCGSLESAGIPRKQAEAQAVALSVAMDESVPKKEDLLEMDSEIKGELERVRNRIEKVDRKVEILNHEVKMVEKTLTIRLGGMITIATGVVIGFMKYFSG
jgi:tetrahydromethanopterin S-methyltransferase subunit G